MTIVRVIKGIELDEVASNLFERLNGEFHGQDPKVVAWSCAYASACMEAGVERGGFTFDEAKLFCEAEADPKKVIGMLRDPRDKEIIQ